MSGQDSFSRAASEGTLPLMPEERRWSTKSIILVMLSSGLASWSYVIGGYVSYYLGARMGTFAMLSGCMAGMLLVVLAGVPCSVRYGIDIISSSRVQFGVRGSRIALIFQFLSIVGWNCLLMILLGRAVSSALFLLGVIPAGSGDAVSVIATELGLAGIWLLLRNGAAAIQTASQYLAILIVALAAAVFYFVIDQYGLDGILAALPSAPNESGLANYTLGFEILVASVVSWWAYIGGMTRMTGKPGRAAWPAMLCLGLATGVVSLIGLYSALVTGSPYPTDYLLALAESGAGFSAGSVIFAACALLFLVLASVSITVVGAYSAGLGLKQLPAVDRLSWRATCAVVLLPSAAVCALVPGWFSDNSGVFFALLGMFFGPVCGIMTADYLILRRQSIDIRGLYDDTAAGPYYYWHGVNPAAIVALAVSIAAYYYLLNPATYAYRMPFPYISATLPAAILAGAVYILVTKLFVAPGGRGGYN